MKLSPPPPPPPLPCWFSLNNSKTLKATSLAFCSIQLNLIRNARVKFGILYSPQSPDIGKNSDGGIFNFWISGKFLIKRNYHKSWTSDGIDMKLGQVAKLDKENKITSKKIDETSCWKIVTSLSFLQFTANLE